MTFGLLDLNMINMDLILNLLNRILLMSCILFFFSCENDLKDLPNFDASLNSQDLAEQVQIIISQEGLTKIKIEADTLIQQKQLDRSWIDLVGNVKISFYNDSLIRESYITGDFARYYDQSKNALIQKNVILSNLTKDTLFSEEIIWNERLKRFFSEKEVTISMDGSRSIGQGLEANEDLSWIRIHQQKGEVSVPSEEIPFED